MRVLLLTQWFDPEPTPKGFSFAKELVASGCEVEVVTGFPNYPGGKVYPGYRIKATQREEIDGVRVTRLPLYPSHDGSAVRRVLNYVSFAASALIYGLFFAKRPSVIYAYHPPLTVGVVASLIRLIRRIPVVYDIQDMWPDTLKATGMLNNPVALGMVGRVCSWVYRCVDRIVVLSPGFKRLLIERDVDARKIDVIYNWCDEGQLAIADFPIPDSFPDDRYFRVLFAGTMGKAQALDAVLDTAKILKDELPDVRFVFVGGGVDSERLKERAILEAIQNVVFIPRVSMNQVGVMLRAANVLLVHLKKDPLFEITVPSKTQAYMAAGKPIVMAVSGDAEDIVCDAGCGFCAESENPVSIAQAVREARNSSAEKMARMGASGAEHYRNRMSLKVGAARFKEIFSSFSK